MVTNNPIDVYVFVLNTKLQCKELYALEAKAFTVQSLVYKGKSNFYFPLFFTSLCYDK